MCKFCSITWSLLQRQTDRKTKRDEQTETDRQIDRKTKRDRQTDRKTNWDTQTETNVQKEWLRQPYRQTDRERNTDRKTNRDRQTETDIETDRDICYLYLFWVLIGSLDCPCPFWLLGTVITLSLHGLVVLNWRLFYVFTLYFRYCTNMLYLSLAYCTKFTNKGLSYMANGKGCHKIVHLDLSGCDQVSGEFSQNIRIGVIKTD